MNPRPHPEELCDELAWKDVAAPAAELFRVWVVGDERAWAEKAWDCLRRAGLTKFATVIEETRVRLRLVALAGLYADFCRIGCDEEFEKESGRWAYEMELSPFRVAQMVGADFESDANASDDDLFDWAVARLVEQEREQIGKALVAGFGDEGKLLDALFASAGFDRDEQDDDIEDSGPEPDKSQRVMEWLLQGLPDL